MATSTPDSSTGPGPGGHNSLRPALFSLLIIIFIFYFNFLGRVVLGPLLITIEADLKLTHSEASRLFLFLALGYSVSLFASGFLSARILHRRMVTIAGMAGGAALLWLSMADGLWQVQAGMIFLGLTTGIYLPSAMSCLTSLVSQPLWGRVMGLHELAPNLGFITAPLLAYWISPLLGWRGLLGVIGLASIAISLLHYWRGKGGDLLGSAPSPRRVWNLLKNPNLIYIMGIQIIAVAAQFTIYSLTPAFLIDEHGMDPLVAQSLLATARLAPMGTAIIAGVLIDRWGLKKSISLFVALTGITTMTMGLAPTSWQQVLVLLQPLAPACLFPACFVLMSRAVSPDLRNVSVGVVVPAGFFIGAGLAPAILGYLGDMGAFGWGFAGVGFLSLLGIIFARLLKFEE